mgnify:CR=1 FL=1
MTNLLVFIVLGIGLDDTFISKFEVSCRTSLQLLHITAVLTFPRSRLIF